MLRQNAIWHSSHTGSSSRSGIRSIISRSAHRSFAGHLLITPPEAIRRLVELALKVKQPKS